MSRVAIVGCGGMGSIHADRYLANPKAELVGVCDIKGQAAVALQAYRSAASGKPVYMNY